MQGKDCRLGLCKHTCPPFVHACIHAPCVRTHVRIVFRSGAHACTRGSLSAVGLHTVGRVRTGSRVKDTLFCKQRAAQEENFDRAIQCVPHPERASHTLTPRFISWHAIRSMRQAHASFVPKHDGRCRLHRLVFVHSVPLPQVEARAAARRARSRRRGVQVWLAASAGSLDRR